MSELYNRTAYLNKKLEYLFGHSIIEYDMKSAGFSIIKKYKLLDEESIAGLEKLPKHVRHVAIGKLDRDNPVVKEGLKRGFRECRKMFFEANDVDEDEVLSIKKDAIFIMGRQLKNLDFGEVVFAEKNFYDSYIYLNKYEFYMNDEQCDCKGINDSLVDLHRKYMLDLFREFANKMRFADPKKQLDFVKEAAVAYRNRELAIGYYRELNNYSIFRPMNPIKILGKTAGLTYYGGDLKHINIQYNYTNYLIPFYRFLT